MYDYCYVYQCNKCKKYIGKLIRLYTKNEPVRQLSEKKKEIKKTCMYCGNKKDFEELKINTFEMDEGVKKIIKHNNTFDWSHLIY